MIAQHFSADFFIGNRKKLLSALPPNALVVVAAHGEMQQEIDNSYPFLQEANFWYLSGVAAPDWRLIVDAVSGKEWLVPPTVSEVQQIFDGSLAIGEATSASGVRDIISPVEMPSLIKRLVDDGRQVHSIKPQEAREESFYTNPALASLWQRLRQFAPVDIRSEMRKLRGVKQTQEIAAIKESVAITVDAFLAIIPQLRYMEHEYQAEGFMGGHIRSSGAEGYAYGPIVASGKNACTLHYSANNAKFKSDDWLLMDIGARGNRYAADITRTFPLGAITERQQAIYDSVAAVHEFAIKLCTPGQAVMEYVEKVDAFMLEQLVKLGLAQDSKDTASLRKYFPHAVSHGLGVETHDPLGAPVTFSENMVLTVEPGIYVPELAFGVRIEDDILITSKGPENLSAKLPYTLQHLREMI